MNEGKRKVLVVDDDAAVTQQLFWTLCDEFEVLTADGLSSAIRRATTYEPDVVLLDLHLPPTLDAPDTGLRILDHVKSHLPASKVFVISSDSSGEVRRECIRRGADGFFDKPPDLARLLAELKRPASLPRP